MSAEEAASYVGELIDAGILVSDLQPAITGKDAAAGMVAVLDRSPATRKLARQLNAIRERLDELDRGGLGRSTTAYEEVAVAADRLVPGVDPARGRAGGSVQARRARAGASDRR